jgi:hypothetical protein
VTQAELLRYLVEALEEIGIEYMISGSQASVYYGEPRLTIDIDVVANVQPAHVGALLERFPPPDFYLSEHAIRDALHQQGQFNIIHGSSGVKIDVVVPKDTAYDRVEFSRRQRLPVLPGREAYFARPEDVIIYKMIYFREGGADRHLRDIAGMLRVSPAEIDTAYVDHWARDLGLTDIWEGVRRRAREA